MAEIEPPLVRPERPGYGPPTVEEAREYVGTSPTSGLAQFLLLLRVGLSESDKVVEIGCGTLHLAKALLAYLDPNEGARYVGVDPNRWLSDTARRHDPILRDLLDEWGDQARLAFRDDFRVDPGDLGDLGDDLDGEPFSVPADVIVSHSVLSHASHAQVREFFVAASELLDYGGSLLASVNLVPTGQETIGDEWVYPPPITVSYGEVWAAADAAGFDVQPREDLRTLYRSYCPVETHDWILATKRGTGA